MTDVTTITARCKKLLNCSDIPPRYKSVLQAKYDHIEKHLKDDPYTVVRCQLLAPAQFQKMLKQAQLLHDCPSASFAYSDLIQNTFAIISIIGEGYPERF